MIPLSSFLFPSSLPWAFTTPCVSIFLFSPIFPSHLTHPFSVAPSKRAHHMALMTSFLKELTRLRMTLTCAICALIVPPFWSACLQDYCQILQSIHNWQLQATDEGESKDWGAHPHVRDPCHWCSEERADPFGWRLETRTQQPDRVVHQVTVGVSSECQPCFTGTTCKVGHLHRKMAPSQVHSDSGYDSASTSRDCDSMSTPINDTSVADMQLVMTVAHLFKIPDHAIQKEIDCLKSQVMTEKACSWSCTCNLQAYIADIITFRLL